MLDIPDIRQARDYDCGSAACDALCTFWKVAATGAADMANRVQGLSPDTAEAVFRRAGLVVLSGTMNVEDLKHLTRDRPVMCPVSLYGGHWVVVRGVARGKVHYHCPFAGPEQWSRLDDWGVLWRDQTRFGHEYANWGLCPFRGV